MAKYKVRFQYLVETEIEIEADSTAEAEDLVWLHTPDETGDVVEETLDILNIERI